MSVIHRQPVLTAEQQEKLEARLTPLWKEGLTAPEIAEELAFGIAGSEWEKLKAYHVYFYRSKFGLEPRRVRESGIPRYKEKHEEVMKPSEFIDTLNSKPDRSLSRHRRRRAYLILHYWTPLRKSEIYERNIEDFTIDKKKRVLKIDLFRKKKRATEKEPINVPLDFPLMNEVVEWLESKDWQGRPFNISATTALNWVKDTFATYYPHFFRFNFITDGFDDADTTITEMRQKTGLSVATLDKYLTRSARAEERMDRRRLDKLKEAGLLEK